MDIVEELRRDRESGARRLVGEYKAGLMSLARRFYKNESDAEELVNATFAKVVDHIDDYLEQSAFFAWMCQILTNEFRDSVRRKSNKTELYPGVIPEVEDADAQEAIYTNLDASLLRDAIETLPEEIKKTVLLHYFMDMPVKEVARVLSSPTSTITWRLHYARRILAAKLGVAADKAKEAAKKPGVKATLIALALCALTAAGAAGIARWGEFSERAAGTGSVGVVPRAAANSGTGKTSGTGRYSLFAPVTAPVPPDSPVASTPTPVPPDSPVPPVITPTTLSKEQTMNSTTRTAALGAATALALAAAPPAASADGYQYIISGDPVAAAIADTDYDVSAGTSLAVGLLGGNSASGALEARRLTIGDSAGTALDSTELKAMVIILR